MEIEKQMDKLLHKIVSLAHQGLFVTFSKVVAGLNKLEVIKTFIVLLFLAQRGDVTLWQKENADEIYITLTLGLNDEKSPAEVMK
jgi:chromatin segregation and condensation protein Rec8/ScpA/Scc1 (kleisin family)